MILREAKNLFQKEGKPKSCEKRGWTASSIAVKRLKWGGGLPFTTSLTPEELHMHYYKRQRGQLKALTMLPLLIREV